MIKDMSAIFQQLCSQLHSASVSIGLIAYVPERVYERYDECWYSSVNQVSSAMTYLRRIGQG